MQQYNPSFCQLNLTDILISGGVRKDATSLPSDSIAVFSTSTSEYFLLKPMPVARHNHSIIAFGNWAYFFGGGSQSKPATNLV